MGYGSWSGTYPAYKGVDGNTWPRMTAHHCSVVGNGGALPHKFKIDLKNFYDIENIIIHTNRGEYVDLENINDTSPTGIYSYPAYKIIDGDTYYTRSHETTLWLPVKQ